MLLPHWLAFMHALLSSLARSVRTLAQPSDLAEEPFAQLRVNVVCACAQHDCQASEIQRTFVLVQIGQDSARHQYARCENKCGQHHQPVAAARMQSAVSSQAGKRTSQPTVSNPTGWRSTFNTKPKTKMKCRMQNEELPKSSSSWVFTVCSYTTIATMRSFCFFLFFFLRFFQSAMHFFWVKVGHLVRHGLQLLAHLTTRDHAYATKS